MTPLEKELAKMQKSIKKEMKLIYNANMHIFDWDLPENNEEAAAKLILDTMQKALDELKAEILHP
jgi:hypothetical protein